MSKQTVKNEVLLQLEEHHKAFDDDKLDMTLGWFVATNDRYIEGPLKSMRELVAPIKDTPEVKAYNAAMEELQQKHAFRDNKGKPIKQPIPGNPGQYGYPIRDMDEFHADEEALKEEHAEATAQLKEYDERWEAAKEQTTDIEFYTIHRREIPDKSVPTKTLRLWGKLGMIIED